MKQLPAEIAVGGTRTAGCDIGIMTHEKVPCIMKEQENMSISEKLNILADAAKYDVSCSSSGVERRGDGRGSGILPKPGSATALGQTEGVSRF